MLSVVSATKPSYRGRTLGIIGLALAASNAPAATAAVPQGNFVASTWAVGLSGGQDEDFRSNAGEAALTSNANLSQNDFTLDLLGRQGTRAIDSLNSATASATRVRARSTTGAFMEATSGMGTIGGGTTGNARASVRVPFMIDAPGLTGTLGTLQVPFLISGNVDVDFGMPVTPFAPWPGNSSGDGRVLIDLPGRLVPTPSGNCIAGFSYCLSISDSGISRSVDGSVPGVATMEMSFRFGDWTSYHMSVETRSAAFANAVATSQVATSAAANHGSSSSWTVRWGGITQVLTSTGDVAQNWNVQSLDGVDLSVATPIPEPSTWAMFGAGMLVLLAAARRRRTASLSATKR